MEIDCGEKGKTRALEEMKKLARRADYKDAKIWIKEDGWKEVMDGGRGGEERQNRGHKAKE